MLLLVEISFLIDNSHSLFVDVKRSTQFLMEYQRDFMFNELIEDDDEEEDAASDMEEEED